MFALFNQDALVSEGLAVQQRLLSQLDERKNNRMEAAERELAVYQSRSDKEMVSAVEIRERYYAAQEIYNKLDSFRLPPLFTQKTDIDKF